MIEEMVEIIQVQHRSHYLDILRLAMNTIVSMVVLKTVAGKNSHYAVMVPTLWPHNSSASRTIIRPYS